MPPTIPPDATLLFEIQVLSAEDRPKKTWEMTYDEQMQAVESHRQNGNNFYREGNYLLARKEYAEVIPFRLSLSSTFYVLSLPPNPLPPPSA